LKKYIIAKYFFLVGGTNLQV